MSAVLSVHSEVSDVFSMHREVSDVFSVHCEVSAVHVVQSLNNAKCRFLQGQDE